MDIQVYFTTAEVDQAAVQQRTVAVIDVLRATSTMVEALANGARAIYPTSGTEEAIKLATGLGSDDTLLCGERKGEKIEGYDLGNSPAEFTSERVAGQRLIMNTTNGTRAFVASTGASRVLAVSFLNVGAAAAAVADADELVVICAGREDLFSLDDAVCAGVLLRRIQDLHGESGTLNDAARAARALADAVSVDASFLRETGGGAHLVEIGYGSDLELCAQVDRHAIVPQMQDRMIRLPETT